MVQSVFWAAFASEGMGLRRQVETVVKPWLSSNARFALHRFDPPGKADDSIEMLTTWHHSLGHPND
jgi:hypothetical protein